MRGWLGLAALIGGGVWLVRRNARAVAAAERAAAYRAQLDRDRIRSDWEPQVEGLTLGPFDHVDCWCPDLCRGSYPYSS